jgi:hypothetical protein
VKTLENKANLPIVFLGVTLLVLFGLTMVFWSDDKWWASRPGRSRFLLERDRVVSINGRQLVYRGLQPPHHFRVDVIIPALDPQSKYIYRIDKVAACEGFYLAGKRFRLVAARKSRLLLERSP